MLMYFGWSPIIAHPSAAVLLSKLDIFIDTISSDRSTAAATNFQATAMPLGKTLWRLPRLKCLQWSMSPGKPSFEDLFVFINRLVSERGRQLTAKYPQESWPKSRSI